MIIAFSGEGAPTRALGAFGVERYNQRNITIALDLKDIDERIELLEAKKRLENT